MAGVSHQVERQEFQFEGVAQNHRRPVFARIGLEEVARHDADRHALRVVALDDCGGAPHGGEPVDGLQGLVAALGVAAHAVDDRRHAGGFVRHGGERRLGHRAVVVRRLTRLVPELESADVVRNRGERLLQFVREHAAHLREHPDALDGGEAFAGRSRLLFHAVAFLQRRFEFGRAHANEMLRAHRVESEEGKERNKADEPVEVTLEKSEEGLLVKIGVGPVVKGLHEGAHAAQINPNPPAVVLLRRHAEKHRRETPYRVVLRVRGVGDRPVWVARRRGEAGAGFRRTREDGKEGFRIDHPLLAEPLVGAGGKKSRVGVARSDGVQHFGGVVRAPEKSAEKVVRFVPFFHKTAAQPLPGPERHAALQGEALSAQILPILWGGFLRRNEKKRSGRSRRALADSLARRQGHRPRVEHERDGRARRRHGEGNLALPHFLHEDARRNPLDDYASVGKGVLQGVENGKNALIEDGGRPRILHGDPKVTRSGSLCGHGIDRKNRGNLSFAKFE